MKRYFSLLIIGTSLMLVVGSCGDGAATDENMADTSMTTMPVETPAPEPAVPDTAMVPRIDPSLDSAARQKDDALPPK